MRIGIIGAGISGLATALELAKRGHEVAVFQREEEVGGLIATFDFSGVRIEHFYHFLCATDRGYFELCEELGLGNRIRFAPGRTGFYYDGKCYGFTTPVDLVRFTPIPFSQRIRFGLFALEARIRKEWVQLDELPAKPWLIDRLGRRTYDVIWDPLLTLKFGEFHDTISAAWVWHRIHRVAKSKGRLGYLDGGTALLIDTLLKRLDEAGVTIHPGRPATRILAEAGRVTGLRFQEAPDFACDRVVSTVPLSVLAKLLPEGYADYAAALERVEYIGVVCLSFRLKQRVSPYFWLNVHDRRVPFNGIIEYTNLNPMNPADGHIVYVPYYVSVNHGYYTMDDDALIEASWAALKTIAPHLDDDDIIATHVARAPFAQAITPVNFLKLLPKHKAPIQGLRLLDSTFLYPEDRTQSGHIQKARACAARIEDD